MDAALGLLASHGHVAADAGYDKEAFELLRKDVKTSFERRWTSITPVMERLMYMLTSVRRPSRMIEFGCFWGNTLAWFAGPCIGPRRAYQPQVIYGVDVDAEMIELARRDLACNIRSAGSYRQACRPGPPAEIQSGEISRDSGSGGPLEIPHCAG